MLLLNGGTSRNDDLLISPERVQLGETGFLFPPQHPPPLLPPPLHLNAGPQIPLSHIEELEEFEIMDNVTDIFLFGLALCIMLEFLVSLFCKSCSIAVATINAFMFFFQFVLFYRFPTCWTKQLHAIALLMELNVNLMLGAFYIYRIIVDIVIPDSPYKSGEDVTFTLITCAFILILIVIYQYNESFLPFGPIFIYIHSLHIIIALLGMVLFTWTECFDLATAVAICFVNIFIIVYRMHHVEYQRPMELENLHFRQIVV